MAFPCTFVENNNGVSDDVIIYFLGAIDKPTLDAWISGSYTFALDPIIDIVPAGSDNFTTTITSSQTADRTVTLPDAIDTLVARTTTDTLTNKTIAAATNNIDAGAITGGTLAVARGGTGQSGYTTGNILYASSATALSKLADVATGNALIVH